MAVILEATYAKKLGLPNYSSHQFSVTLKTEITDPSQVGGESGRLYDLLQGCVDTSIQKVGFLPEQRSGNGNGNGNGHGNGQAQRSSNGGNSKSQGDGNANGNGNEEAWSCSPKQKNLILRIVEEHGLEKNHVESIAQDRFGKSIKVLNKLETSALIDELLMQVGGMPGTNEWQLGRRRTPPVAQ